MDTDHESGYGQPRPRSLWPSASFEMLVIFAFRRPENYSFFSLARRIALRRNDTNPQPLTIPNR